MIKDMKKLTKILILIIFGFILSASFVFANGDTGQQDLSINLSNFLGFTVVRNLPDYIARVYNIMIGLAGGLASFMFIVAGFQYVLARGDASKIGRAKKRMTNSIVALFLIFGAYFILNTINPAILSMKLPEIQTIERKEASFSVEQTFSDCTAITNRTDCEREENCIWLSMEIFSATEAGRITGTISNWIVRAFTSLEGNEVGRTGGEIAGEWVYGTLVTNQRGGCVLPDPDMGTDGHACRPSGTPCNEGLRCIEAISFIIGNSRRLCTAGATGSPCRIAHAEEDCFGIEPESSRLCVAYMCMGDTDRPNGSPCTSDTQCDSNHCLLDRRICAAETGGIVGADCRPPLPADEDTCGNSNLFCCPTASADLLSCTVRSSVGATNPKCIEKLNANSSCIRADQCKSNYCNDNACDCLCDYGESCASPCPSTRRYCVDEGLFDTGDHCQTSR
jgi:hypothetical protein